MSPEEGEIGVKITADDKASKSIKGVQSSLKGIGSSLAGLIGIMPAFNAISRITGWLYKTHMTVGLKAYAKGLIIATINTLKLGIATLVALWPIILIIAAVVAAVMIAILIYQNWGNIAEWLKNKWNTFIQWLHKIWEWIVGVATTLWTTFKNFITGIWNTILLVGTTIWTAITSGIMNLWNTAITFVKDKAGWILNIIKLAWGLIRAISQGDWSLVAKIIQYFIRKAYIYVMQFVDKIISAIGRIPIIGPFLAKGAMMLRGLINIPSFQFGTRYVMHDTLAMVHKGERIIPSHGASYSSHAGNTFNIDIAVHTGSISSDMDVDNIGRRVAEYLERELGRTML